MSWEHGIGYFKAVVVSHKLAQTNSGALFVSMLFEHEGQNIPAKIFLTEKAMGMARRQLKRCGFDPDTTDVELLHTNQSLLAGNRVDIEVKDEGKYGLQASVMTSEPITKTAMKSATKALRAAKKASESEADAEMVGANDSEIPF